MSGPSKVIVLDPDERAARQVQLGFTREGVPVAVAAVTDARPDTGGLSGATPSEAVSWGKIDPDQLPDTVVAYLDSTIALPIITSYALARRKPRKLKRLYERRDEIMARLKREADRVYRKY